MFHTPVGFTVFQVRASLTRKAERSCKEVAAKLYMYLKTDDVKARLLTWREDEAPSIEAGDFDVTKFNAEKQIMIKIQVCHYVIITVNL